MKRIGNLEEIKKLVANIDYNLRLQKYIKNLLVHQELFHKVLV